MVKPADLIKESQNLSTQLSVQVRTIALSILALSWGLLVGTGTTGFKVDASLHKSLVLVGLVAITVLVLDFFQYLFGYWNTVSLLKTAEIEKQSEVSYYTGDLLYQLRRVLFYAKMLVAFADFVYLLVLLLPRVAQ